MIDILLGGDKAVVVALAYRNLPPKLRTQGIIYGTVGAIVILIAFAFAFALALLATPYLKIFGRGLAVIDRCRTAAAKKRRRSPHQFQQQALGRCQTQIIADLVMSVENVLAIAGAAQGPGQHPDYRLG